MGELERLRTLHKYKILDTVPEEQFDRIVRIARMLLDMPLAAVSLVDRDRQWFKARCGIKIEETPRKISFCTHTIMQGQPLIVENAALDPRFADNPLVTGEPYIKCYVGVPLITPTGESIGALCCMDMRARRVSDKQVVALRDLSRMVIDELELGLVSQVDPLTGVLSRRRFVEEANREITRVRRYRNKLSCAIVDIDGLRHLNTKFGHQAGDDVLREVAAVCQKTLRATDFVGRVGPDEFGLLMPETSASGAYEAAERIRSAVAAALWQSRAAATTVSIGIAEYFDRNTEFDGFLLQADSALAQGKLHGPNMTSVFGRPNAETLLCAI